MLQVLNRIIDILWVHRMPWMWARGGWDGLKQPHRITATKAKISIMEVEMAIAHGEQISVCNHSWLDWFISSNHSCTNSNDYWSMRLIMDHEDMLPTQGNSPWLNNRAVLFPDRVINHLILILDPMIPFQSNDSCLVSSIGTIHGS